MQKKTVINTDTSLQPDLLHWTSTAHKFWKNFKISNTGILQFCRQFRFHITFICIL